MGVSDDVGDRRSVAEDQGRGGITAEPLVGRPRPSHAHVGGDDETARRRSAAQRSTVDRDDPAASVAKALGASPSAAWIAVAFVLSR